MNRIGYCCIAIGINEGLKSKDQIKVNRGMVKKTFELRGLSYVYELAIQNIRDMRKILEWNIKNDILVYRMSSDMFPCLGFYKLEDIHNFDIIKQELFEIGKFIKDNKIRVSFHPSHFCIIASENSKVVENAIDELNKHAQIMDLMQLDQTHYYPINIHIGTTKPSLELAAKKFCLNFNKLSDSCKKRLTVENDDSQNQYSTKMLYDLVYKEINVPIIFDQHHFNYGPQDQTLEEALRLAHSTWLVKPMTHMSSPRTIEDDKSRQTAHADYIYEEIQTFGLEFDTEIEAKAKDLALIRYRSSF
jgi:UV DNA damage endonuclease